MIGESIRKNPRDNFDKWFSLACQYAKKHGNLLVSTDYVTDTGEKLGAWINSQRVIYKSPTKRISASKVAKLEEIGMIWNWYDMIWEQNYNEVKEYYDIYHNLSIPDDYKNGLGAKLSSWLLFQQRLSYQENISMKSLERMVKLEELGYVFKPREQRWEMMYKLAEEYQKRYHNLLIPVSYETKDGKKLGEWIRNQRSSYSNGKLLPEKIRKLEAIGMAWVYSEYRWDFMYNETLAYLKKYGTLTIYKSYQSDNVTASELGSWVVNQRILYKTNNPSLNLRQRKKLEEIGINRDSRKEYDDYMFEIAYQYYLQNGHLKVPRSYKTKNDDKLGFWVENQRQLYRDGSLDLETFAKLDKLGMVWEPRKNKEAIDKFLEEEYPEIDKKLNKATLDHLSLQELKSKINYLALEKHLGPVDDAGCLRSIFSMSSVAMKDDPEYGLTLEEMIKRYGETLEVDNFGKTRKLVLSEENKN